MVSCSVEVVSCAYNEQNCIEELIKRLQRLAIQENRYDFTFVIVDNGSTDATWSKLLDATAGDSRFRLLQLSRNFGTDGGLAAGLSVVHSDACVFMAADLQDPPEMISDFLRKWEAGYENIYMVVTGRPDSSALRRLLSRLFYFIIDRLTAGMIPRGVSDFRLVDRKVYEAVRSLPESSQFLRGMFAWVGFRSVGVPSVRPERFAGRSKASFGAVLRLARVGVISFTDIPLRMITWVAVASSLSAFILFGVNLVLKLLLGAPRGFASLLGFVLLGFGTLSFMLAVIAQYLSVVHSEVKSRPTFIVSRQIRQQESSGNSKSSSQ
jgi:dolichol-phosphate mannosyltransferase